ncbi:1-pyrroline-5-carboxylate dehydrogenase [Streptomyces violarus]
MGNTVVVKPAAQDPLSVYRMAQALEAAGVPPGVVNVVSGARTEVGDVELGRKEGAGSSPAARRPSPTGFDVSIPTLLGGRTSATPRQMRPVVDRDMLPLPAPADTDDGRLALYARLAGPGHDIPFFTTHFTSAVHASAVRCRQVAALAEFVDRHRGDTPFPPVVTGDLNAWPDSDEIRLLGGYKTAPAVPRQVLLDAWEYADPAAPSATWDAANPYVAPTHEPSARIDYIHVGPPGPGGLGHVRDVRRACDGPVDGVWPSDHAAVVADLA